MVSVLVLVAVITLALILFLSPFLSKVFNLTFVKPLLDEFQSCFQDKYRSYSAVYLIAWIVFRLLLLCKKDELLQILLIFLATTQTILCPYQSKWLNISDTMLLWCLVTITGLSQVLDKTESKVLIHVLILVPLFYFLVVLLYTVMRRVVNFSCVAKYFRKLGTRKKSKKYQGISRNKCVPVSVVAVESDHLREPLLGDLESCTSDSN